MNLDNRGNWTLIGLLVVVAIVVVGVYFMARGSSTTVKSDGELLDTASKKQTVVGKSIDTGKSAVCQNQLSQLRKGIENYKAMNGTDQNPATLMDIGLHVSNTFYQCPVSGKAYTYDPATGKVACPTHPNM